MYKPLSKHTIDLLDRKFQFLMESQTETFLFDLLHFINFLRDDDTLQPITDKLGEKFLVESKIYLNHLKLEKEELLKLKNETIKRHPELLQTAKLLKNKGIDLQFSPLGYNWEFFDSACRFNETLHNGERFDSMFELTSARQLLEFFAGISSNYKKYIDNTWQIDKDIFYKFAEICKLHDFKLKEWRIFLQTSPANIFAKLQSTIDSINPQPKENEIEKIEEQIDLKVSGYFFLYLTGKNLGDEIDEKIIKEQTEKELCEIKSEVKRVYEAIREEIGTNLLHIQLINRYKVRSQIYNKPELRKIVEDKNNAGRFEDVLTLDLARFLFDSGLSTYYRVRAGSHEYDLIDLETNTANPMFVEAKVYKDSQAKQTLIEGIYQLHSYLCEVEAKKLIDEAYYIIFRVGGPIYVFPENIKIGKFSIYPILIDLGKSEDSGRNQRKPIEITLQEILNFKYEPETENDLSGNA
jgi:hypothetical protein